MCLGHQLAATGAQGMTFPGIWKHVPPPGIPGAVGGAEVHVLAHEAGTVRVNGSLGGLGSG